MACVAWHSHRVCSEQLCIGAALPMANRSTAEKWTVLGIRPSFAYYIQKSTGNSAIWPAHSPFAQNKQCFVCLCACVRRVYVLVIAGIYNNNNSKMGNAIKFKWARDSAREGERKRTGWRMRFPTNRAWLPTHTHTHTHSQKSRTKASSAVPAGEARASLPHPNPATSEINFNNTLDRTIENLISKYMWRSQYS